MGQGPEHNTTTPSGENDPIGIGHGANQPLEQVGQHEGTEGVVEVANDPRKLNLRLPDVCTESLDRLAIEGDGLCQDRTTVDAGPEIDDASLKGVTEGVPGGTEGQAWLLAHAGRKEG